MNAPSAALAAGTGPCCDGEEWKPVPGWPHEASSCGRVWSVDRLGGDGIWRLGGEVPRHPDRRKGKGYEYVVLLDGPRRRKVHVAAVVLEAHRGLRPAGHEACHDHGIRGDNHLARLRWDTHEANVADIARHAAGRAVTDAPAVMAGLSQPAGHGGVAVTSALSLACVTGDGSSGTGRSRLPFRFPSVLSSLRPAPGTLRNQQAA